jgi:hypothetical protein
MYLDERRLAAGLAARAAAAVAAGRFTSTHADLGGHLGGNSLQFGGDERPILGIVGELGCQGQGSGATRLTGC